MTHQVPLVVRVGGGFGGLAAARALRRAPVSALLIDKSNHHVFRPLLYQITTSVLAPGQIASSLRGLLANQKNTSVMLATVTGIDAETRQLWSSTQVTTKDCGLLMTIWCSQRVPPTATSGMMSSRVLLLD